jgi:indolepyruvate ferredoxin oxidoreductase alpha subunit
VRSQPAFRIRVDENCSGCRVCLDRFECPALVMVEETGRVVIDEVRCAGCGVCVGVCPQGAILRESEG